MNMIKYQNNLKITKKYVNFYTTYNKMSTMKNINLIQIGLL